MASKKTKTIVPIILVILLLIVVLAFKVKKEHKYDLIITSDSLLNVVSSNLQLIKPIDLAGMIETNEEKFVLIDIRSQHKYNISNIKGAINISFNDILDPQWQQILSNNDYKKILYCDLDINSNEAWMLLSQLGYKNIFVLEGGLSYWEEHIKKNYAPFSFPSNDESPLFNYKKEMERSGNSPAETNNQDAAPLPMINSKKKEGVQGGCG